MQVLRAKGPELENAALRLLLKARFFPIHKVPVRASSRSRQERGNGQVHGRLHPLKLKSIGCDAHARQTGKLACGVHVSTEKGRTNKRKYKPLRPGIAPMRLTVSSWISYRSRRMVIIMGWSKMWVSAPEVNSRRSSSLSRLRARSSVVL